jgi:membrane-associated phospholipid phosphatase
MRIGLPLAAATMVLFVSSTCAQPAGSQENAPAEQAEQKETELTLPRSSDPGKQPFLRNFVCYEWRMSSSAFRGTSYDTPTVKKHVIPFALISTALIAADRKIVEVLPNTTDQTVWSGRVSQLGAAYSLAGVSGAVYLFGRATGDKHARETGWIALEALAHTQLVVFGIKQATNRCRPITDEARGGFWNGGDSFPSGHAASSFAVAAVFAYEYRDHLAVPITAYFIAALVSVSRVSARRQWASDI